MRPVYATVEDVTASPELAYSAYAKNTILAKLQSSSDGIDKMMHRRFYPERRTILIDWPNYSSSPTWEIDLGDNEMISFSQVLSNSVDITTDVDLRREDDKAEPPYGLLQVDLSSSAAFSSGVTWQRAITITGLFCGAADTATTVPGAALSGAINSSVTTLVLNPSSGIYTAGIGSLILIGTERLLLQDRRMSAVSGQTLAGNLDDLQSVTTVGVTSGAAFAAGEIILIDSERMRINDIAGNNLIVTRAHDGTVLSTHTAGASIYALRTFTASRGALGSTAAAHSDADLVYVHEYPPLVNELCVAETLLSLQRQVGAYGSGPPDSSTQRTMSDIKDVRERAWIAHARKSRKGAI